MCFGWWDYVIVINVKVGNFGLVVVEICIEYLVVGCVKIIFDWVFDCEFVDVIVEWVVRCVYWVVDIVDIVEDIFKEGGVIIEEVILG